MSVPRQPDEMRAIQMHLQALLAGGRRVYVHCRAGIGRTGTVIGCFLAERGSTASRRSDSSISYGARASARQLGTVPQPGSQRAAGPGSGRVAGAARVRQPGRPLGRGAPIRYSLAMPASLLNPRRPAPRAARLPWTHLSDEQLLGLRMCDLRLDLQKSRSSATSTASITNSMNAASAFARTSGCRKNGSRRTACPASPCRSTWRTRG